MTSLRNEEDDDFEEGENEIMLERGYHQEVQQEHRRLSESEERAQAIYPLRQCRFFLLFHHQAPSQSPQPLLTTRYHFWKKKC